MKYVFQLFLILVVCVFAYGQNNNLNQEQIKQYANELGVTYEALQQFLDTFKTQTNLCNPNANNARLLSVREIQFMQESDLLSVGAYYIIQAEFYFQNGRTVFFHETRGNFLTMDADFLVNIIRETNVTALISVRLDILNRPRELFLVEIIEK